MRTIAFSAIKGGVGKSSLAILTANFLAASGKKVLAIDADPQNSMSFYYNPDSTGTIENLAEVLYGGSIRKNIIDTQVPNVSLVPSSLELIKCRDCNMTALEFALQDLAGYDYCIIDTAPTFDNVVINCAVAADMIVTPVQFGAFDYKSAIFYKNLLGEMDLAFKWRILFNKFKPIKTGAGIASQFLNTYVQTFGDNIFKARIPESAVIKQYFDVGTKMTRSKAKLSVFEAMEAFAAELSDNKLYTESF